MDALGAVVLIAGLFWLTRTTVAEGLISELDRMQDLPPEKVAARNRFLDWFAALPDWPGAAVIFIGCIMIVAAF